LTYADMTLGESSPILWVDWWVRHRCATFAYAAGIIPTWFFALPLNVT